MSLVSCADEMLKKPNSDLDSSEALIGALRKILRPLIFLLLKSRIIFPQFSEIIKNVYIEVAEDKFKLAEKEQTDSRLSLLTGIHRKDIRRLRANPKTKNDTPPRIDIGARLVSHWISDPVYQDKSGNPLELVLKDKATSGPSFEKLVYDICKQDIRARVVLDEWLNLGVVTLNDSKVKLNTQAFIAKTGSKEKTFFLGHNIADHLASATCNLLSETPPFFERCIYYDGLSKESIQQLEKMVENKGMEAIVAINTLAKKLKEQDIKKGNIVNSQRINIGLYVYHEAEKNE